MPRIRIPGPFRALAAGAHDIDVDAPDLRAALHALATAHGGIRPHLIDDAGTLRPFVNVYVNGIDARVLAGEATPLAPDDLVVILPPIAGG